MKVVILRMDALGDNLLSTPALVYLKERVPGVELVVFTHRVAASVYRDLAEVVLVEPQQTAPDIAEKIRALEPRAILVFCEKRRAGEAARRSGCRLRIGFDPGWSQPLKSLWTRVGFHHRVPSSNSLGLPSSLHEVERYGQLVTRLIQLIGDPRPTQAPLQEPGPLAGSSRVPEGDQGSQPSPQGTMPPIWFPLTEVNREQATAHLRQLGLGRPVGLQLTPKWSLHQWGPQELMGLFSEIPGERLLLYGPGEAKWVEQNFGELGPRFCSGDLVEYGAVVQTCSVLITPDTGAVHVASGVGTPVVDVFPSEHWSHCTPRWRPWKVEYRLVASGGPSLHSDILQAHRQLLGL